VSVSGSGPGAAATDPAPAAPGPEPETETAPAGPKILAKWEKWLLALGVLLGTGVATLGLISSYQALEAKAAAPPEDGGWGWAWPWLLPVGVDLSILAFSIVNLLLVRFDRPLWWVKWVPRAGTAVTVYLNWEAASSLPSQIGHAVLASLWVVFSEIAAHLYAAHIGATKGRIKRERIPRSRWLLAPFSTPRIARRMRLWNLTYRQALEQDRQVRIYRERLRQRHHDRGRRWKEACTPEEMLPFNLGPLGFSVEDALAVPTLEDVREQQRKGRAALQRAEAAVQQVAADVQVRDAEIQAEIDRVQSEGRLRVARQAAEAKIEAEIQRAEADVQRQAAEAQAETRRIQDETEAHSTRLAEETERRRLALDREREEAQLRADLERTRILAEQKVLEAEAETEIQARIKTVEAKEREEQLRLEKEAREHEAAIAKAIEEEAERRLRTAEHEQQTAAQLTAKAREVQQKEEIEQRREANRQVEEKRAAEHATALAELKARAAEHEARAAERAAMARLGQVDWDTHRVAAMLRAAAIDPSRERVTVATVATELGVSTGTAQDRIKRAQVLLENDGDSIPALRPVA
ncbi:DUF2637 domain-containing protein, partial [Streptomyces alkaliphilus]